ncbi:DNA polymerase-3 subunit epsilon [Naumannella cuiyingiana]|uniref:DNA polymerase-3 subunit epsilon n=1 Tax=Naumannella cuiyingiana TaxID=1347891 RepID=A0A7Z0ILU4_9ACTN|nr:DEDD exonuclease domain-containing protein [Naumannella cuiyingiana]NYI72049.1 DNA polymerase-3 subunit epsilon [Naumannella cuiyingiana]
MTAPRAQPSFDDLGTPLSAATFCVVDLETTGSGPGASITEFGAVKVRAGERLGEFQTLVRPVGAIPASVTVLTGITNEMTAGAPSLAQALPAFLEFAAGTVLVAHNAPFDTGFLRRACAELGYPWPGWTVLDTAALARTILLREEVRNCRLGTLARHFGSPTTPDHRALTDARATVDVLHGLFERVGNLGVGTVEDLVEFSRKVSPQRRRKRVLADGLPEGPGTYAFVSDRTGPGRAGPDGVEILYVGTSVNVRRRVRSYFTAAEKRRRMEEMVRLATAVRATPCATGLEAEVTELRLILAHRPRYNRKSRFPEREAWLKLTREAFPRLSVTKAVRGDGCDYLGPFPNRQAAQAAAAALHDAFPIRQCTARLSPRRPSSACALAELGRCAAPCDRSIDVAGYAAIVDGVRIAWRADIRAPLGSVARRLERLIAQRRFEEAAALRDRLDALRRASVRMHRIAALARCPQMVAAAPARAGWDIHVIRHGRLAAAGRTDRAENPLTLADELVAGAATVPEPTTPPLPAGSIAEAELLAGWLERPGVRLIEITGDWTWPVHAGISRAERPAVLLGALG